MDQSNANTEICFEVRDTALRSRLHTEKFSLCPHKTSHTGNLHWGITCTRLGVHNSSLQQPPLHKRQGVKPKQQSPLHKEGQDTKPNSTTIISTQRGIGTNPNHNLNHLCTRGMNTNPKQRRDLQLGDYKKTTNQFSSQKQDPINRIEMIAQVWENKVFGKQITKKNIWENTR